MIEANEVDFCPVMMRSGLKCRILILTSDLVYMGL